MIVVCYCDCQFEIGGSLGVCPQCGVTIEYPGMSANELEEQAEVGLQVDADSGDSVTSLKLLSSPNLVSSSDKCMVRQTIGAT